VQDETGAINLHLMSSGGIYQGDSVRLFLNGLILGDYENMLQLDSVHVDENIVKIATDCEITPEEVEIGQIQTGAYQGELIKLTNVQFIEDDIGKTFVDIDLLNETEKLTKREFEKIKEHPVSGADVIKNIQGLSKIENTIRHHHERIDGMGYPNGLKDDAIPLHSKIIAVADAYDAMVTNRPYRNRLTHEEAVKELVSNSGSQFSKSVVDSFLEISEESQKDVENSN
jgi:hypothetical protein